MVVQLTGANDRTVRNWFEAKNGPSGELLVALCRHSDEVLDTVLRLAGRTLHALANGRDALARLIRATPKAIAGTGLLLALGSGVPALLSGTPFLTHRWAIVGDLAIGTALVFDIGVYLTVVGAVLTFFDFYMEA